MSLRAASRYAFLDLLRGIAASSVMVYHLGFLGWSDGLLHIAFPELGGAARYGYLGVELFFLISGYVIAMSLEGKDLRTFVMLRAIRIYPTFWFCIAITVIATTILPGGAPLRSGLLAIGANALMVNLPAGLPYVDTVYWSLALEIQFYIVAALAFRFGGAARLAVWLLVWLACGALVQGASYLAFHGWRPPYPGGEYIGYFCAGSAIYLLQHGHRRSAWVWSLLVAGLAAAAAHAYVYAGVLSSHFHTYFFRPLVVTTVLASALAVALATRVRLSERGTAVAAFVGGVTYPLYCLHQYLSYTLLNSFARGEHRWAALLIDIAVILALASAVYVGFDKPVRRWLVSAAVGRGDESRAIRA